MSIEQEKRKALFIVVEGIDGCGKDTQLNLLEKHLIDKGYKVHMTNEPTNGKMGRLVRNYGLSCEHKFTDLERQLMFSIDRGHHVTDEIEPALKEGKMVLSGRYSLTTLAYGYAAGLNMEILESANERYRNPDLVIYIDLDADTAMKRINSRGGIKEVYERSEFLKKAEEGYKRILPKFNTEIIDGHLSQEEVQKKIVAAVSKYL